MDDKHSMPPRPLLPESHPRLKAAILAAFSLAAMSAFAEQITPAHDGLTAMADGVTLQVTALRDNVLRVREWKGDNAPEDASWAVVPSSRTSNVPVTVEEHGFTTKALHVIVDDHLRLTVADLQGNVLQKDATPVQWEGNRFYVSKE